MGFAGIRLQRRIFANGLIKRLSDELMDVSPFVFYVQFYFPSLYLAVLK